MKDFGLLGEIEVADPSLTDDSWNYRLVPVEDDHDFGNLDWDNGPTPTSGDNNSAINLSTEDLVTVQNRFYSRLCHYAKIAFENRVTNPIYVPTDDNWADGFTKVLGADVFLRHLPFIRGLIEKLPVDPGRRQSGTRKGGPDPVGGSG